MFTVIAGKYDGFYVTEEDPQGHNIKFINEYQLMHNAVKAFELVQDYDFAWIEVEGQRLVPAGV